MFDVIRHIFLLSHYKIKEIARVRIGSISNNDTPKTNQTQYSQFYDSIPCGCHSNHVYNDVIKRGEHLLPRPARYCFHPVCLSVCVPVCVSVCVCLCVCPANILVFYFSAIRRDIDLKCIQDTYRVVLNSLKN